MSLPAVAAVLLLAGCGDQTLEPGSGPGGGAPSAGSPTAPGTVTPRPTRPVDPSAPSGKPTAGGPVTIEGVVEAGVEPGCKVLTAGGAQYQLLGGEDVPLGVPVRVTGQLAPGVLTTCQQGTPIRVTDVQRR